MNGRVFFDTNILLYLYGADHRKRELATSLFRGASKEGTLLISTQVVQEFHAAGSKKLRIPSDILRTLTMALLQLPTVVVQADQITAALELETRFQIPFWDSLILAAADSGGARVVFSEDLNHGQRYGNVVVENPFLTSGPA